jgi:transposase
MRAYKYDTPTEGQLRAWRLVVREGKTFRQAAQILGVSKSTIQQRIEAMRQRQSSAWGA